MMMLRAMDLLPILQLTTRGRSCLTSLSRSSSLYCFVNDTFVFKPLWFLFSSRYSVWQRHHDQTKSKPKYPLKVRLRLCSKRNMVKSNQFIKRVRSPVISSAISGLDGDGWTGPERGEEQCGRPPLHQAAVLLQEGHTRLSGCLGRGECGGRDSQ